MDVKDRVSVQTTYEVVPSRDSGRFIKMRLRICHTGVNRNGSLFTLEDFENARGTLVNIPILAHVVHSEEKGADFGGHDMRLVPGDDGAQVIYDEIPIGVVPESCNYAIEEYDGRQYVCADAYIWRKYSNYAQEIIEENAEVPLSMEIDCYESTTDKTYGVRRITKFCYTGITFLGQDHLPAMINAGAVKQNFEEKEVFEQMVADLNAELAEEEEYEMQKTKEGTEMQEQEEKTTDFTAPIEDGTELKEVDGKAQFALMTNVQTALNESLSEYTYEEDGVVRHKYWLYDIDFDKQLAYVMSSQDWNMYAARYAVEGDAVTLVPNFKRQVMTYRDYVDGQDTVFEHKFEMSENEAYLALKTEYEDVQKELEVLKKFQADTLAEQKQAGIEAIFATFADLEGQDEFKVLKEHATEYELDALEKECYALRGKLGTAQFAYNGTSTGAARQNLPFTPESSTTKSALDTLIEKYKH